MSRAAARCAFVAALAMTMVRPAAAQQPADSAALRALRSAAPVRLDGIPDEPAWRDADSIAAFRQRDPDEGAPSSLRTVVRMLATDAGLLVAFWNYDDQPGDIRHAQLRRDADFETDDRVGILLDPQRDRRSGYVFIVNPNGALYDGEVLGAEDLNENWDGVWDARARITAFGWTAELLLPWQLFRHPGDASSSWGLNLMRFMRRKNEEVLWQSWRRPEGLLFQEKEGTLEIPGALPRRRPLELRPYAAVEAVGDTRTWLPSGADSVVLPSGDSLHVGIDGKLAVSPTLTLDLTVNTDFAQVEVDRQVVNLTRFPVFFPEKRGFFLEASGNFAFGQEERTQLFHSRRIGLDSNGVEVPIVAGIRLSGRAGHERLGLLAVRTGGAEDALDGVVRLKHDIFSRGYVGGIVTARNGPGVPDRQVAGGLDVQVPLVWRGQNVVPSAFVAWSQNGAGQPVPSAWRVFLDYPNDNADHFLAVSRIGAGFDPALGFVLQNDVYRATWALRFYPRPHRWGVRKLQLSLIEADVNWALDGTPDHAIYAFRPLGAQFESGDEFSIYLRHLDDAPRDSFDVFPGVFVPAGSYGWNRAEADFASSPARAVGVELTAGSGGYYDGHSTDLEYALTWRVAPHVVTGVDGSWQWVTMPASNFTAQVHRLRFDYAATPRLGGTLFLQWNNETNRVSVNARLHFTPSPGTDAYLVWNSAWPTDLGTGVPWSRPQRAALVAKYVHYFRF